MTGGDSGKIKFFDITSKERLKKLEAGDGFITALAKAKTKTFIAAANQAGQVFIINASAPNQLKLNLTPHFKTVRQLAFINDDTKVLSASDDSSIKMIDIPSEKVIQTFEGHKLALSSVSPHEMEERIFFSTSFDKTVKIWDLNVKGCVGTASAGGPLWDCKSVGKNLMVGGENGLMTLYSVE